MARPGLQPNAQIIGRLDLPFGVTVMVPRPGPALTYGSNRDQGGVGGRVNTH